MDENGSAFFRFLELPFKFIKRDVELSRKVAISGFHEPSISAQNKITTHLKCYKNSSHILDFGCTDSEINIVLMKHTECCTPDDFPKTSYLNYASHRLYTFLKYEQPREAIYYYGLAESGFYFCNTESVVKCYFCPAEYKRIPSSKNGSQIHRMNKPSLHHGK
jgi:hypothetical protein